MEIAFIENSQTMNQGDLAFMIRALNVQMEQHWAPAYLEEPWPCRSYSSLVLLAPNTFWPIAILDDVGKPGAKGFHDFEAGLTFGRVQASKDPLDGTTASHEALELRGDPEVNIWIPIGDGRSVARELCDPCEDDAYSIPVTIGDETRAIMVSDFVLPAWFVPGAPGPFSFLDNIDEPFGLSRNGGGYRLVRDAAGTVSSDFGRHGPDAAKMARKIADPMSRTARRGLR